MATSVEGGGGGNISNNNKCSNYDDVVEEVQPLVRKAVKTSLSSWRRRDDDEAEDNKNSAPQENVTQSHQSTSRTKYQLHHHIDLPLRPPVTAAAAADADARKRKNFDVKTSRDEEIFVEQISAAVQDPSSRATKKRNDIGDDDEEDEQPDWRHLEQQQKPFSKYLCPEEAKQEDSGPGQGPATITTNDDDYELFSSPDVPRPLRLAAWQCSDYEIDGPDSPFHQRQMSPQPASSPDAPRLIPWTLPDFDESDNHATMAVASSSPSTSEATPLLPSPSRPPSRRVTWKTMVKHGVAVAFALALAGLAAYHIKDAVYYELVNRFGMMEDSRHNWTVVFAVTFVCCYSIMFGLYFGIWAYQRHAERLREREEISRRQQGDETARVCRLIRAF